MTDPRRCGSPRRNSAKRHGDTTVKPGRLPRPGLCHFAIPNPLLVMGDVRCSMLALYWHVVILDVLSELIGCSEKPGGRHCCACPGRFFLPSISQRLWQSYS